MNHIRLDNYNLLLNVPSLFAEYMKKLVIPVDLNALYVFHPVSSATDARLCCGTDLFGFFCSFVDRFSSEKPGFVSLPGLDRCSPAALPLPACHWLQLLCLC